ncbi:golgin-84 [Drosophila guanche]|uniref:Blast:Golgin-84 n=2 Tax=Drosophila guanche TaxID=7266 RepID=A0A3B0JQT2_DROGU|nr:golgin-84 [Drosophila guanche]SPP83313.1 blast:Golgin-84 [Drosophila guanche]
MSSWITGLADKAENILNKLDQNAATALQLETPVSATGEATSAMKRSMTSSTNSLSLKSTTLSPAKRSSASASAASSVKSDQGAPVVTKEMSKRMTTSASFSTNPDSYGSAMADTHELAAFKIALNEITAERDELRLRLHELSHDSENLALQERAQELETLAQTLSEERDKAVHDLNDAHTAHMAYVHSISELETNLAKLQQEYMSAANKLQMQTKETEQHRLELHEYRTKAQRALQAKDALIAELKAKPSEETSGEAKDSESRLLQIEYEALKQELEHAHEEVHKMRLQLEDNVAQEQQRELELSSARQREESLAKELRQAREHSLNAESEQRMLTQELASMRQQLSNQMAAAATRLQEREQQVQQLRQRLSGEVHTSAKNDYESRLKALTQSLVERQGLLERVTGERNALRLQHEQIQMQLQQKQHMVQIESQQRGNRNSSMLSNSTDDAKAQFPVLMHPSPFDNRVARRFKRALRQADSMGIRVGTFLRRYPMMRVSVIVYVALLHLWVMFVLLSTTPN